MKVGSLFSGIGGFDLGLERAGMEITWQSEIDPYASRVLKKHWPNVPNLGDIRAIIPANIPPVDLICGGFPCQPFSEAGKRRGKEDDRYLWPEMRRIIEGVRPSWVVGENVPGIIGMELDNVLSDLESLGYATRTFVIPAAGVGARHRRDRVWIVAYSKGPEIRRRPEEARKGESNAADGSRVGGQDVANAGCGNGQRKGTEKRGGSLSAWWESEPDVGRVAYGVPDRVDRLKGLGNAVVPKIVEYIGRGIIQTMTILTREAGAER